MNSFTKKKIDIVCQLANNQTFNDMGDNTLNLTGLRVEANIQQAGGMGQGSKASIKIYGMAQSDMNKLSVMALGLNKPIFTNQNRITILAGFEGDMTKVFEGCISSAWADYGQAPEVPMIIQATPLYVQQHKPTEAIAYEHEFDIGEAMSVFAEKMGLSFINVNVHRKHPRQTFSGTLVDQAISLAKSAGIYNKIEFNTMTIAEYGTPVNRTIIEINPSTGLVGYPAIGAGGIFVSTLFNPNYTLQGIVRLSDCPIEPCNGRWLVKSLSHVLESEKPNGAWFSNMDLVALGEPQNATGDIHA